MAHHYNVITHLAAPRTGEARSLEARQGPFFRIPAATLVAMFTVCSVYTGAAAALLYIQSAESRLTHSLRSSSS